MKKRGGDFVETSDTLVISPDHVVLKSPIQIFLTERRIGIRNLWTFFSFKRLSKRVVRRINSMIGVLVRRFLDAIGYKDVDADVNLNFEAKTSWFIVSFKEEDIMDKKLAIEFTKYTFSKTCLRMPEYSVREYKLMPFSEGEYRFFVVLAPYSRELSQTLNTLNEILKYPYVTLPNNEGIYYLSGYGEDNINEPPKIIDRLTNLMRLRYIFIENKISDLYSQILPANQNQSSSSPLMAQAIKEIVQLIDYFNDTKPIYKLLQVLHKVLGVNRPSKEDLASAIDLLENIIGNREGFEALNRLYKYLQSLYDELLLIERIEEIGVIRATLRRLNKMLCIGDRGRIDIRGIPGFINDFILTGSVLARYQREPINLGSGKAIYIGPREWECISKELGITEKSRLEIKIVKRHDGKKYLVISFPND